MKKTVLFLILSLVLVLAACGNQSKDSETKSGESKGTVKINNNFEAQGDKRDGSDAKKVKNTVKVPKNPKKAIVLDYGALDTLKEFGVEDQIKGLPKGENNASLPKFLDEFKSDKYENTGNLKEVNFDKIAAAKPDVIYISGRTASQKNLDEFKRQHQKQKLFMLVLVRKIM